ncbi:MAG: hypothetical protein RUMPE_00526 [Eubacteriales bacterium SKADARSKE-1]|nr:hypothetical protein [Eubacteriales bacterium SKADARSKE-1]
MLMEYNINKEELGVCKVAFEGCSEQSIDLDFNLPDYCPDIQRILKCHVCPKISARTIVNDRLNVEGISTVSLMYLDSEKKVIRYCEHSSPFSASFNLKENIENAIIITNTKVEYINCRATSPRRLDIHGAFSVCVKVKQKNSKNIICGVSGESIEQKKITANISNLVGLGQQQFSVNETIELTSDSPAIESIIRSNVAVFMNDYRTITNKLIINATALLNIFYISDIESGQTKASQYSVPISQIIDMDGIEDDSDCHIILDVLSHDLQVKVDGSGNGNLLALDMKVAIIASAYENKEIKVLADTYSTEYEYEPVYENVSLTKFFENIDINHTEKSTIELNVPKILEVMDTWVEVPTVNATLTDGNIVSKCKLNVCILALNNEQEPVYSERPIEFEHIHNWQDKPEDINIDTNILVKSIDCKIMNNQNIEVALNLKIPATIHTRSIFKSITSITIDEEKPIVKDTSAALIVYYANKDENIWDIAKSYNTSINAIKIENEMEEDILKDRQMILIPI